MSEQPSTSQSSDNSGAEIVLREPIPGDLGWVVHINGETYAAEYGWTIDYEALVARIISDFVNDFDPERERAWIATLDNERVGSIFCRAIDDETAQLRLLLVAEAARGRGLGNRLVTEVIEFARAKGFRTLRLWTNSVLVDARRIYERHGFVLVDEEPHHSFGHDLVGQTWELGL